MNKSNHKDSGRPPAAAPPKPYGGGNGASIGPVNPYGGRNRPSTEGGEPL